MFERVWCAVFRACWFSPKRYAFWPIPAGIKRAGHMPSSTWATAVYVCVLWYPVMVALWIIVRFYFASLSSFAIFISRHRLLAHTQNMRVCMEHYTGIICIGGNVRTMSGVATMITTAATMSATPSSLVATNKTIKSQFSRPSTWYKPFAAITRTFHRNTFASKTKYIYFFSHAWLMLRCYGIDRKIKEEEKKPKEQILNHLSVDKTTTPHPSTVCVDSSQR